MSEQKPKMKGVLAQLSTMTKEGKVISTEIVFKPVCEWHWPEMHDNYAESSYKNIQTVIDEYGLETAEKVFNGEIVEVEREAPEGMHLVSCPVNQKFERETYPFHYPIRNGTREALVRKK